MNSIRVFVSFCVIWNIIKCNNALIKLKIDEESPIGTKVGNIDSFVLQYYKFGDYKAAIMNDYFDIRDNKDLIVKQKFDLDTSCNAFDLCCGNLPCNIDIDVYITTSSGDTKILNVMVEIKDINDNKPYFRLKSQRLKMKENMRPGSKIPIDGGLDNDASKENKIKKYKFEESTETFELNDFNMNSLQLSLSKMVDYEVKNRFDAFLYACDSNSCTKQNVTILIRDVNDNQPIFDKLKYEKTIDENFPVGEVCLKVIAIDKDSVEFNETKYDIFDNNDPFLTKTFSLNSKTGEISVRKKLSATARNMFDFQVKATDVESGIVSIDKAAVVIKVRDVNDHKPLIQVFESDKYKRGNGIYRVRILENQNPQKLMAMIVSDGDLGDNGRVTCSLSDDRQRNALELKPADSGYYDLRSKRSFDYEKETRLITLFECRDSGLPPQSSYIKIHVDIEDENEFSPRFEKSEYNAELNENTRANVFVLKVAAKDGDRGAVLRYSLIEKAKPYFKIDPVSGEIKTDNLSFDRERIDEFDFLVIVQDAAVAPKTASVNVKIKIQDLNDNDPIFDRNSLQFSIRENKNPGVKLRGQLRAIDHDMDIRNKQLKFSLKKTFDNRQQHCNRVLFQVLTNGYIQSLERLDREEVDNYTLTIMVSDSGHPSRSSLANATVLVIDENDNAPQWNFPRPNAIERLPSLNISAYTKADTLIMRLQALDPDSGDAGRVTYELSGNNNQYFRLNSSTGELFTIQSPLPRRRLQLNLIARDMGQPIKRKGASIVINVIDQSGPLAGINLAIVVGMIVVTLLIALFLIIGIVCVRRRPNMESGRNQGEYLASNSLDVIKDRYSLSGCGGGGGGSITGMSGTNRDNSSYIYPHYSPNPMYPQAGLICDDSDINPMMMQTNANGESYLYLPSSGTNYCHNNMPSQFDDRELSSNLPTQFIIPSHPSLKQMDGSTIEALNSGGTMRSINPVIMPPTISNTMTPNQYSMMMMTGLEYDGESADSGKGASEVDLRLQMGNNIHPRYSTMPFPHHHHHHQQLNPIISNPVTTFGYQSSSPSSNSQYCSITTNPRYSTDTTRRALSPNGSQVQSPNKFFMLPEDDIIHHIHDKPIPLTTFNQKSNKNTKNSNEVMDQSNYSLQHNNNNNNNSINNILPGSPNLHLVNNSNNNNLYGFPNFNVDPTSDSNLGQLENERSVMVLHNYNNSNGSSNSNSNSNNKSTDILNND